MKKIFGIMISVIAFVLVLGSAVSLYLDMQMKEALSASVGIIGGADGPTSVFVAGRLGTPWGLYIVTVVVVIVTIIYFVKKHKR